MCNHISDSAKIGINPKISHNVIIMDDVEIGDNVILGNNVIIYPGTRLGNDVFVQDNSVLGKQPKPALTSTLKIKKTLPPLEVGNNCNIGTSAIIFAGTKLASNVTIGDMAFVREGCEIGEYSMLGKGVTIENQTTIGHHTKIQADAYITGYTIIEDYVFIAPMVTTTNDNFMGRTEERFKFLKGPHIKRGARIGGNSIILPGIIIGEEAFVAAGSIVTRDVPPAKLVIGVPAREVRDVPKEELLR